MDEVLRSTSLSEAIERDGRASTGNAVRVVLDRLRHEISADRLDERGAQLALTGVADAVERELRAALSYSLKKVINATGVVLHTNLGRAPLSAAALDHLREIASGYSNLEFDLETGERGRRDDHAQRLLTRLLTEQPYSSTKFGGQDPTAIVVNNCAAAVLLALNTLADRGEVVVSRGELVEIGGSFRVPEIMAKSGAILREVGTTNRTRISDYEQAIGPDTRLLLRVHRSNFALIGFTEQPSSEELVALARKHGIPVLEDLGNGLLVALAAAGLPQEHGLRDSLSAGVDVVCVSGDKLLGGPQAGIIAGRPELVKKMRANPLFRALRGDKLTYAALEATLLAYLRHDYAAIPALQMIFAPADEIRSRVEAVLAGVGPISGITMEVVPGESVVGGGAAPNATIPTFLLAIASERAGPEQLQSALRSQNPPMIARVQEDRLILDLRTVFAKEDAGIISALRHMLL